MKRKNKEAGSMTLETTIVLPIFILVFLAIFGIFSVVSAENQISHAFIQSTKSISMDPFLIERTDLALEDKSRLWGSLEDLLIEGTRLLNYKDKFMALDDWYSTEKMTDDDKLEDGSYSLANATSVPRNRFIGFFANGDETLADEKLRQLGVVNGLEGIQFSMSSNGGNLTVTIAYELEFVFNFFDAARIPMSQKLNVKLWT